MPRRLVRADRTPVERTSRATAPIEEELTEAVISDQIPCGRMAESLSQHLALEPETLDDRPRPDLSVTRSGHHQEQSTTPTHSATPKPQTQFSAVQAAWGNGRSGRMCALASWPESNSGRHPASMKSLIRTRRSLQLPSMSIPLTTCCSSPKNLASSASHRPIMLAIAPLTFRESPKKTTARSARFISHLLVVLGP